MIQRIFDRIPECLCVCRIIRIQRFEMIEECIRFFEYNSLADLLPFFR